MGMGTGLCCCGDDTPPPDSSSHSVSSSTKSVICGPCQPNCHTPGVRLPDVINAEFTMLDNGDPWAVPYVVKGLPCDCEEYKASWYTRCLIRQNPSQTLYATNPPNSCTWASECIDCYRYTYNNSNNGTNELCPYPFNAPPTQRWQAHCEELTPSTSAINPHRVYLSMQIASTCGSKPELIIVSTGITSHGGTEEALPCPALVDRTQAGKGFLRYNEVFSCDPFYYQADIWIDVSATICCIYSDQSCCSPVTSIKYEGYHVVLS